MKNRKLVPLESLKAGDKFYLSSSPNIPLQLNDVGVFTATSRVLKDMLIAVSPIGMPLGFPKDERVYIDE